MLRASESGGEFEYLYRSRVSGSDEFDATARAIEGTACDVIKTDPAAGTLTIFCGRQSLHRVAPVRGQQTRVNAVLSYSETPDERLDAYAQLLFHGRTAD